MPNPMSVSSLLNPVLHTDNIPTKARCSSAPPQISSPTLTLSCSAVSIAPTTVSSGYETSPLCPKGSHLRGDSKFRQLDDLQSPLTSPSFPSSQRVGSTESHNSHYHGEAESATTGNALPLADATCTFSTTKQDDASIGTRTRDVNMLLFNNVDGPRLADLSSTPGLSQISDRGDYKTNISSPASGEIGRIYDGIKQGYKSVEKERAPSTQETTRTSEQASHRRARDKSGESDDQQAEESRSPLVGSAGTTRQLPAGTECMNPACPFKPIPPAVETNFRTCILDHFGRNKSETVRMKRTIVYCRKCYQHASYRRNVWPEIKCDLIVEMLYFNCIDEGCLDDEADHTDNREDCTDHCQVRYNITMRAGELQRLKVLRTRFNGDIQAYIDADYDSDAEIKQYKTEQKGEKIIGTKDEGHSRWKRQQKSFIRTPIQVLKAFHDRFVGTNKTRADCIAAVDWCRAKFEQDDIDDIPRFEFVIQCPRIKREIEKQRADKKSNKRTTKKRMAVEVVEEDDDEELPTADNKPSITSSPPKRLKVTCSNSFTPINGEPELREDNEDESSEEEVTDTCTGLSKMSDTVAVSSTATDEHQVTCDNTHSSAAGTTRSLASPEDPDATESDNSAGDALLD